MQFMTGAHMAKKQHVPSLSRTASTSISVLNMPESCLSEQRISKSCSRPPGTTYEFRIRPDPRLETSRILSRKTAVAVTSWRNCIKTTAVVVCGEIVQRPMSNKSSTDVTYKSTNKCVKAAVANCRYGCIPRERVL